MRRGPVRQFIRMHVRLVVGLVVGLLAVAALVVVAALAPQYAVRARPPLLDTASCPRR
jgi:hypothetical protein